MKLIKSTVIQEQIYMEYDKMLEDLGVSYEEAQVVNEFGTTHVILVGNSKNYPLLMLHDITVNSAFMWSFNIDELSSKYYCILVDIIGSPGKSTPNQKVNGSFNQFAWLDSILMELNIEKCFGLGAGVGADILQSYMLYNLDVKKLICIEGGINLNKDNAIIPLVGLEGIFSSSKSMEKRLEKHLNTNNIFWKQNEKVLYHVMLLMKGYNQFAIKKQKASVYSLTDTNQIEDRILYIFGKNGIHDKLENDIERIFENKNYRIIEDCGHLVNMEKAEIVNNEIIHFLEGMNSI
jgi:pimeloyl-ACP methyl ester carboxylesterase